MQRTGISFQKTVIIVMALLVNLNIAQASNKKKFEGSFKISIIPKHVSKNSCDYPDNIIVNVKGDLIASESNNSCGKGKKTRSLFSMKDSTDILIEGDKKWGFLMHTMKSKLCDLSDGEPTKITETGEVRIIDGYKCHKVIVDSKRRKIEAWITKDISLCISESAEILSYGGESTNGQYVLNNKNSKGCPIEIKSYNKITKSTVSVHVYDIKKDIVDDAAFSIKGYDIEDSKTGVVYAK